MARWAATNSGLTFSSNRTVSHEAAWSCRWPTPAPTKCWPPTLRCVLRSASHHDRSQSRNRQQRTQRRKSKSNVSDQFHGRFLFEIRGSARARGTAFPADPLRRRIGESRRSNCVCVIGGACKHDGTVTGIAGRFIHKRGYFIHLERVVSNALAETAEARNLANILIDQETRRVGCRVTARQRVARSIGTSPGTIENIQRSRLKKVSGWLRDALRARVIRELEAEIVRLQHELAVLRQSGSDPRSDEMAAVRADLSAVLEALGRDRPTRVRR